MLDFAKLEDGRLPHVPSETEVGPLIERALAAVRTVAEARRITLSVDVDERLPSIRVDPEQRPARARDPAGQRPQVH